MGSSLESADRPWRWRNRRRHFRSPRLWRSPMNDALREAAEVDPKWAEHEWQRQLALKVVVGLAVIALVLASVGLLIGWNNQTTINHIEHTACAQAFLGHSEDPDKLRECEEIR